MAKSRKISVKKYLNDLRIFNFLKTESLCNLTKKTLQKKDILNPFTFFHKKDEDVTVKRDWFLTNNLTRIEDHYDIRTDRDLIGEGSYGKVVKAKHKITGDIRAVKILPKSRIADQESFRMEIELMRSLDHPHIIKFYETFEDSKHIYIILELCKGGELFDKITEKGHFTESEARKYFTQMVKGIHYCHEQKICHRDLKPENFLLVDETDESPIKLIDFGFAHEIKSSEGMKSLPDKKVTLSTRLGTPYYIAPEVLKGSYDELCDVWSLGVILYILLSGYPPFFGESDPMIFNSIEKGEYDYRGAEWSSVSFLAKDLIDHILCKAENRYNTTQILNHPWMHVEDDELKQPLVLNFETLKSYKRCKKLKKAALAYIATQLAETEIHQLSKLFEELDKNSDGFLSFEEIQAGLKGINKKALPELQNVLEAINIDHSGKINYTEFIAATMEKTSYLKEERLKACFKIFDKAGDGKITADELREVLGSHDTLIHKKDYWEKMIKEGDLDGDGYISFNDFVNMMKSS